MNVGDVVYLKSGSPRMVVTNPNNEYGKVGVGWIDGRGQQHYADFPEACLVIEQKADARVNLGWTTISNG